MCQFTGYAEVWNQYGIDDTNPKIKNIPARIAIDM